MLCCIQQLPAALAEPVHELVPAQDTRNKNAQLLFQYLFEASSLTLILSARMTKIEFKSPKPAN